MKAKQSTKNANHLTTVVTFRLSESDAALLKAEAERRGFTGISPFVRALALSSYMAPDETTMVLETVLRVENTLVELVALATDKKQAEGIRSQSEAISGELLEKFLARRSRVSGATK